MPKAPRHWTVTRHDPIEVLEDNLWAVNGDVPGFATGAGMDRRMAMVKLSDGRLVFHNAVPLDDGALAKVKAWGNPAILIVPHHLHAMDAHAFREKLGLKAYTAKIAIDKVRAILPVEGTLEELPKDPALRVEPLAGMTFGEAAYAVQSGPRSSLLFADVISNSRPGKGFAGFMFNLLGFAGPEPTIAPLMRLRAIKDKKAVKQDLLRLADTQGLTRLVPTHGLIVSQDASAALKKAANKYL